VGSWQPPSTNGISRAAAPSRTRFDGERRVAGVLSEALPAVLPATLPAFARAPSVAPSVALPALLFRRFDQA
jgi:hypothetical protein